MQKARKQASRCEKRNLAKLRKRKVRDLAPAQESIIYIYKEDMPGVSPGMKVQMDSNNSDIKK